MRASKLPNRIVTKLNFRQRLDRIRVAGGTSCVVQGVEVRICARRRSLNNEFRATSRGNENGGLSARLGHWVSIQRNHFHWLWHVVDPDLQRKKILKRSIQHTPELLFSGLHVDNRGRSLDDPGLLEIESQLVRSRNPRHQKLLANRKDSLGQTGHLRTNFVHSLDDDCSSSASIHLELREPMNVRVVPIQSRRLVGWNLNVELKIPTWLDQRCEHIILVTCRRNVQPMEMHIGGVQSSLATIPTR